MDQEVTQLLWYIVPNVFLCKHVLYIRSKVCFNVLNISVKKLIQVDIS